MVPALRSSCFVLLTALVTGGVCAQRTPDDALRTLQEGNRRFAADRSTVPVLGDGQRRTLARGQSPHTVVLCCADSRVPPEHVFNTGLGELFVVRLAGHVADAETIASVEHAVERLGASLAVVLGHEECGVVAAALARGADARPATSLSPAMTQLLERIEPAVQRARGHALGGKELHDRCEVEHAHETVHDCLRQSELLRRYAAAGRFRMVAARYHLRTGEVEWLPQRPLPAAAAAPDAETAPAPSELAAEPAGMPPHTALRLLQAGHRRFLGDGKPSADLTALRRDTIAHGQRPLAIVLTCADSRTAPEHLFDAGLGELFVVRVAGNVLGDGALASIELAATRLGASLIVVMGHTGCDAVAAATEAPAERELSPHRRRLLLQVEPSVAAARAARRDRELVDLAVRAHTLRSLAEARARSGALRTLEQSGRLALLGCVYDTTTGDLEWLAEQGAANGPEAPMPPAAPGGETRPPHVAAGTTTAATPAATTGANGANGAAHGTTPGVTPSSAPHAMLHAMPDAMSDAMSDAAPAAKPDEMGHVPPAGMPAVGTPAPHAGTRAPAPGPIAGPAAAASPRTSPAAAPRPTAGAAVPAPHPATPAEAALSWRDPIVWVGLTGVASLLSAALLTLRRR